MIAARATRVVRWLPPAAAVVYAVVLIRRLADVVHQLAWNADFVSVMVLAETIGRSGKAGRAVIVQIGYFWFDLATLHVPFHRQVWEYAPYTMALATLLLLTWTAWRLGGMFAAVLTASVGVAASPLVLATQAAQSFHGTTWFGTALLAAYLRWLLASRPTGNATAAVSALVAVVIGLATATDPLLIAVGDLPFVAAVVIIFRARVKEVSSWAIIPSAAMIVAAGLVTGGMVLADRLAGYGSSFPRGLTHLVPPAHFRGNLDQLVRGVFEVAGMPHQGSQLGIVLGLMLTAGVALPTAWLIRSLRGPMPVPKLGVIAFWSASAVFVAAAFLFSDVPSDFLQNSARYLVSMFYVAAATIPLWAAESDRRLAAVAAPAAVFILANAASVEQAASSRSFEPAISPGLNAAVAFLEQHGLTRGYAAYDDAAPMSWSTDLAVSVYPVTEVFVSQDDTCGTSAQDAICPFAYDSASDWYAGSSGPTFILVDAATYRLDQPPPASLDSVVAVYNEGRFVIYVYGDDVAGHMGTPRRFTRPLI